MVASTLRRGDVTLACLTIDDPLLRPKYGCLEYAGLLREMKAHRFFTEVAFIPWNYRRSSRETVLLLVGNGDCYAVCVHGCDHLYDEFGGRDYEHLSALCSTALWRMDRHQKLTGMPYEPVFVFPQGRFSSVAMRALRDQGYLAAFNSTLRATDGVDLSVAECGQPATLVYDRFPLFQRRHPNDRIGIEDDVVSGRPVILVVHHDAFREGYGSLTATVDWLNGLCDTKWCSLAQIAQHHMGARAPSDNTGDRHPRVPGRSRSHVVVRRLLSEARDNYLQTSPFLSRIYARIRKHVG